MALQAALDFTLDLASSTLGKLAVRPSTTNIPTWLANTLVAATCAAGELGSASISASVVPTHMCVVYSAKQASACVRRLSAKARAQKFTFTATAAGTIAGARASTHAIGACRVMRAGWGGGSAGLSAKRRQHRAERWGCGAATKAYCYSGTGLQGAAAWGRPHGRMRQIVSPTAVAGKVTGECS